MRPLSYSVDFSSASKSKSCSVKNSIQETQPGFWKCNFSSDYPYNWKGHLEISKTGEFERCILHRSHIGQRISRFLPEFVWQ